ncbi:MAG TPA: hypothetical protein VGR22_09040 [Thermomicrobiales bacterium]|nr:hypothetical protein [Thermomicrobiales bacterium]
MDQERLLASIQRGIRLDLFNAPADAVRELEGSVWGPLRHQPALIEPLLSQPVVGSWLARSAVQLSHALIETGRWGSALTWLRLIDGWLSRPGSELDQEQLAGQHWTTGPGDSWQHGGAIPAGAERVSLRAADLWIEAQQYLALVQRDGATEVPVERLAHVQNVLRGRPLGRRFSPECIARYRGVIGHDLASLKLRRGYPPSMVLQDLDAAEAMLRAAGNTSMLAPTMLARASALGRLLDTEPIDRRLLNSVEHSVSDAMRQGEADPVLSI